MSSPAPRHDRACVTETGRRLLIEQLRKLDSRIKQLQHEVDDGERSPDTLEAFHRSTREASELRSFLQHAASLEDMPADPHVVEVGDTVVIQLDDATQENYTIVHAVEAATDEHRISLQAPLAQALLHHRIGEHIDVQAPSGSYRCSILRIDRTTSSPTE